MLHKATLSKAPRPPKPPSIQVCDFVVYQEENSYGEFNNPKSAPKRDVVSDIANYIKQLTYPAAAHHLRANFTAEGGISAGRENHLTRLVLNEYGLYPSKHDGPLGRFEFEILIKKIQEMAASYPPNFHLILGTVPLKINDTDVLNVAIFVECGKNPRIIPFAKAHPETDNPDHPNPTYPKTRNIGVSARVSLPRGFEIPFGANIISKTVGGLTAHTAADICYDHSMKLAKNNTVKLIEEAENAGHLFPELVSHVVISNTATVVTPSLVSETVTQADPFETRMGCGQQQDGKKVPVEISMEEKDLPRFSFGPGTGVNVYPSRRLGLHVDEFAPRITRLNTFNKKLMTLREKRKQNPERIAEIEAKIDDHIISLLNSKYATTLSAGSSSKRLNRDEIILSLQRIPEGADPEKQIARVICLLEFEKASKTLRVEPVESKSLAAGSESKLEILHQKILTMKQSYEELQQAKINRGSHLDLINKLLQPDEEKKEEKVGDEAKHENLLKQLKSIWDGKKKRFIGTDLSDVQLIAQLNTDLTQDNLFRMVGLILQEYNKLPPMPIRCVPSNKKEEKVTEIYDKYGVHHPLILASDVVPPSP